MKKILCLLLLLSLFALTFSIQVASASDTVYLSDAGSDSGAGTLNSPYQTLGKALESVSNNGTIRIVDTVTLPAGFSWSSHGKTVTVSGGTLDATAVSGGLVLGDHVTFDATTLTFASGGTLYANGNNLTVNENVTVTNPITVYGGGKSGSTVSTTNVKLLAGTYSAVYGGSNGGTVTGNTNLYVGGKVNTSIDATNHGLKNYIYGGGYKDTIKGNTNVTFTGNAKAIQVFGGSHGAGAVIQGETFLNFTGGHSMGLYGGNHGVNTAKAINVNFTDGYIEQIFGGCSGTSYTGTVNLKVLGGEIARRIYGGCYNEVTRSGLSFKWQSSYYVTGNITVTIGGNAKITFDYDNDTSIYAHSRQKTLSSSENSTLIFADATAYDTYKNKLKAQDFAMMLIMGSTSAADAIHYYTYTADDTTKTITEKCAYCQSHAATATLSLDESVSLVYTGNEIKPVTLTHSADWEGEKLSLTYRDNRNVGTATASCTKNDATVSLSFTIEKATQNAPSTGRKDETIKGKGDGKLTGLTTAMEYSTDGTAFTAVTNVNMQLPAGTYTIRYAETATHHASPVQTVTIGEGRMLKITFKAEGFDDVVKEVTWNGTLSDIPAVPERDGYTETAPYWDTTVFTNIQKDTTVTAVYTKDPEKTTTAATTEPIPEPTDTTATVTTEPIPEPTDTTTTVTTEPGTSTSKPAETEKKPSNTTTPNQEASKAPDSTVKEPEAGTSEPEEAGSSAITSDATPEESTEEANDPTSEVVESLPEPTDSESEETPSTPKDSETVPAESENDPPADSGCGMTLSASALIPCLLLPVSVILRKKDEQ